MYVSVSVCPCVRAPLHPWQVNVKTGSTIWRPDLHVKQPPITMPAPYIIRPAPPPSPSGEVHR